MREEGNRKKRRGEEEDILIKYIFSLKKRERMGERNCNWIFVWFTRGGE
jgi:hypothetical protein